MAGRRKPAVRQRLRGRRNPVSRSAQLQRRRNVERVVVAYDQHLCRTAPQNREHLRPILGRWFGKVGALIRSDKTVRELSLANAGPLKALRNCGVRKEWIGSNGHLQAGLLRPLHHCARRGQRPAVRAQGGEALAVEAAQLGALLHLAGAQLRVKALAKNCLQAARRIQILCHGLHPGHQGTAKALRRKMRLHMQRQLLRVSAHKLIFIEVQQRAVQIKQQGLNHGSKFAAAWL